MRLAVIRYLLALCLALYPALLPAAEPARVLIVGTYHFSNPGQDQANVDAVDVTAPQRQAELQAITDALAKFAPTMVARAGKSRPLSMASWSRRRRRRCRRRWCGS